MATKRAPIKKTIAPKWNEVGYEFSVKARVQYIENGDVTIVVGDNWDTFSFDESEFVTFLKFNDPLFNKIYIQEQIKETKARLAQLEKELGEIK